MTSAISAHRVAAVIAPNQHGSGSEPSYSTLAAALRQAISDGRLSEGLRLPSERDLTGPVGLSRTTVTRAYGVLREQGYLLTRRGSGSVITLPLGYPVAGVDHLLAPAGLLDDALDLTCTAPSAPAGMAEAYAAAMADLGAYLPGTGYYPTGLPALRERIAARWTDRGLATTPEQVMITSGALSGAAIALRALVRRGDRVVVESPTYPNAIATLAGAGARVVAHPIDHRSSDWELEALSGVLRQTGARAAYLIPDFHNPTGALMSEGQRARLGRLLRERDVVPIIDESLVDLPLEGQVMPAPLARQVPDSITVGSASKWLWGGLRIGWLRAPAARAEAIASSRLRLDLGAPVLEQLVVLRLLDQAEQILAGRRAALREGREVLLAGLAEHLPDWRVTPPDGGMALWCELPTPGSVALTQAARRHDVVLAAGPNFSPTGGLDSWVRLPYSLPPVRLAQVAPRLAAAWAEVLAQGAAGRHSGERARFIA